MRIREGCILTATNSSEWQHDDKKLPMAYFDFGYSAADIKQNGIE